MADSVFAVDVQSVSKHFRLYKDKNKSIKERMLHPRRVAFEDLWALRDVNFTVAPGETVGILGHNGSGKSTLLKTICGVLQPSSGQVLVRGKRAGLLELGAGFEPELSGRDNIYLNGAMLGIPKAELDRVFDEIVAFSELGPFIDNQVKFYSSGMYVRLGFAVAVNVDPDVLVVDEVLAVGDERFQRKCMDRIKQFQADGRTILFVSQTPEQVRAICDRVVVLHHGEMIYNGDTGKGIRLFREKLNQDTAAPVGAAIEGVTDLDHDAGPKNPTLPDDRSTRGARIEAVHWGCPEVLGAVPTGKRLEISIDVDAPKAISDVVYAIQLINEDGEIVAATTTETLGMHLDLPEGKSQFTFMIDRIPFLDSEFQLNVGLQSRNGVENLFAWAEQAAVVEVTYAGRAQGLVELEVSCEFRERTD